MPATAGTPVLPKGKQRRRDASRSKAAILASAERLFADNGYESTTLEDVGVAAGVSRGTPAYFFGSKRQLYEAVLDRAWDRLRELVLEWPQAAMASADGDLEAIARFAARSYIGFLLDNPQFTRLVDREVLAGGASIEGSSSHVRALSDTLAMLGRALPQGRLRSDYRHVLLSVVALCWFPVTHRPLVADLGLRPEAKDFRDRLADHVVDLAMHGALKGEK
jgi:AcrR family transcriptional regulator